MLASPGPSLGVENLVQPVAESPLTSKAAPTLADVEVTAVARSTAGSSCTGTLVLSGADAEAMGIRPGHAGRKAGPLRQRAIIVLLDIGLPGLNGWRVAEQIRERANGKRPFIIAISGYARPEDYRRSAEAGIDLHLAKPADPNQLAAILQRFCEQMNDARAADPVPASIL